MAYPHDLLAAISSLAEAHASVVCAYRAHREHFDHAMFVIITRDIAKVSEDVNMVRRVIEMYDNDDTSETDTEEER